MRIRVTLALVPLASLFLAPFSSAQSPPAAPHAAKAKKQKAHELPSAPVSELITRILEVEARYNSALRLCALATTSDERKFAQKVVRLADHEFDLAFLIALSRAADNSEPPTPEARELQASVKTLQESVDAQQAVVDKFKKQAASATGRQQDILQEQLELEEAKLDLANGQLSDAREDLINAGGDLKSQIERLQAEHDATEKSSPGCTEPVGAAAAAAPAAETPGTLLANLRLWMKLHSLRAQVQDAQDDATSAVETLRQRLDATEKEVAATSPAAPLSPTASQSPAAHARGASAPSGTTLEILQRQSRNQKILAGYKVRIRDLTEIASTYGKWDALEAAKQKETTRSLIFSALWIALVILIGIISNRLLQHLFTRMTEDRRRLHTLRTLSRFGVQAFCLALILLVVLGPPSQLATLVAFAGAGLTVALKDFIVSFIGWFMLMGRNGVHVGDWVEINGVCGEVIEVNLFHTVMLETGAWNDPGHPTGRKVTSTNAYAIEGHYFNFTTSGQWLWDEIEFLVPPGEQHPNAVADAILQMVTQETAANAHLAEQEWSRLAPKQESSAAASAPVVSAAPALSVRPSGSGISGRIRYVTRANERFQTRTRLFHLIVEALHPPAAHA